MTPAPDFNGLQVWLPQVGALRPGDILLTRHVYGSDRKGDRIATAIRTFTGGDFDHAAICTSPPTFAEAGMAGVSTLSLHRCFAFDLANVRILRWPDAAVAKRAASLAQVEVGRVYSKGRAIASVFPNILADTITDRGVFCSSLVALVFRAAGADPFTSVRPDRLTPVGLLKIPGLVDVTAQIFREGLAPGNAELLNALDGDRVWSPSDEQTAVAQAYAQALLPITDQIVAEFPEARLTRPETFFGVIQFLIDALEAVPDVGETRREAFEVAVHSLDEATVAQMDDGRLAAVLDEYRTLEADSLREMMVRSREAAPDIDLDALQQIITGREASLIDRHAALRSFEPWCDRLGAVARWHASDASVVRDLEVSLAVNKSVLSLFRP